VGLRYAVRRGEYRVICRKPGEKHQSAAVVVAAGSDADLVVDKLVDESVFVGDAA